MDTVNEHILSLSGKASLQEPLNMAQDYQITVEGEIRNITDTTRDDGTVDRLYRLKIATVHSLESKGHKVQVKDKSPLHAKIRARQWIWQNDNNSDIDYQKFGQLLINHFDEIMNYLIELK